MSLGNGSFISGGISSLEASIASLILSGTLNGDWKVLFPVSATASDGPVATSSLGIGILVTPSSSVPLIAPFPGWVTAASASLSPPK